MPQTAANIQRYGERPDGSMAGNLQEAGLVSALAELVCCCFCSLGLPAQANVLADAARVLANAADAEMELQKVKEGAAKCPPASSKTATCLNILKSTAWD